MIGITDGQSAASALDAFERAIDRSCPADRSVVLRYRKACRLWESPATDALEPLLPRTSLGEGMRVVPLFVHRGVTVDVLDSTSLMATHTHKSVDGCVTTAHCLRAGYSRIVFESGGNTGAALTLYASRAGIETFLFLPAENLTAARRRHLRRTRSPCGGRRERRRREAGRRGVREARRNTARPGSRLAT